MGNLYISAYGRSNVGKKRGNNEDNFYLSGVTVDSAIDITSKANETKELAFAVFDGMGGEAAGEKASQYTAVTYGQKLSEMLEGDFSPEVMQSTIETANKKVCDEIRVIGKRMGCTFVSAGFKNDNLFISNVGDSRAYILRNGTLHCVSKDHTAAQTMVDAGLVSYEDSQKIKEKHQLTQHIGIFPEEMMIEPNYNTIRANSGDIVMLCSDGLTDMLSDADIETVLSSGGTEEELTNALVEKALDNGGKDNVTVIVGKVSGVDAPMPVAITTSAKPDMKLYAIIGGALAVVILAIIVLFATGDKTESDEKKKDKSDKTTVVSTDTSSEEDKENERPVFVPETDDTDDKDDKDDKIDKDDEDETEEDDTLPDVTEQSNGLLQQGGNTEPTEPDKQNSGTAQSNKPERPKKPLRDRD